MPEYYDDLEHELYEYDDSDDDQLCTVDQLTSEEWQDWNSRELLNLWMSVVEYHEMWYLPLHRTFNQFCEFVYQSDSSTSTPPPPEVQAICEHPWIKDLDWNLFFSLNYK